MRAWLTCTGAALMARDPADTLGRLAAEQQSEGHPGSPEQHYAWLHQIAALRAAILEADGAAWTLALEYALLRLEKRIDAVLLTGRAILVLEFKTGEATRAALAEAEDYALDLHDFHAGSRVHPILPILVAGDGGFTPPAQPPLFWHGALPPIMCGARGLGALLRWVETQAPPPRTPLDAAAWMASAYHPVPHIIEAATMLYARNGVAEIASARADTGNLTRTTDAIRRAILEAQATGTKRAVFVTGIPGAGKTLCGLNTVFAPEAGKLGAFLTGNVPLVTVLRAALAEDAMARGETRDDAMSAAKQRLQNVHRFLDDNAGKPADAPAFDRLIVFDEAQRAWDAAKARLGTRNKPGRLTDSEPAHTLEIMGRHQGWAVIVALIGNGQEINTGEAGLAEWGRVIAADPRWRATAAPRAVQADDPRQRLVQGTPHWLTLDDDLDLTTSIRNVRDDRGAAWVDAVLQGDTSAATHIAASGPLPYFLTRDAAPMYAALRRLARGNRRAGLLASSGAKRLRAEGFGPQLDDIAAWFLRRWPDIRASDALETHATEYDCQGLELDVVGLAWGGDFLPAERGWVARRFAGTGWQRDTREFDFVRNTYRVLLTRARYETIIWVPRGSPPDDPFHDRTRDQRHYDSVAATLLACGVRPLEHDEAAPAQDNTPARLL